MRLCAGGVAGASLIPVVYVFAWSFWGTPIVGVLHSPPSLRWFRLFVQDPSWTRACSYSLAIACIVSSVGVALFVLFFYGARFAGERTRYSVYALMIAYLVTPPMLLAMALRLLAGRLGLGEMLPLFLGQVLVVCPVQYFALDSIQTGVPSERLLAGITLGATHGRNLLHVYWPQVRRAAFAAWGLGFLLSFDELVIALMVIDSNRVTVPRKLWEEIPRSMDPLPAVIGTLLVIVSTLGLVAGLALWHDKSREKSDVIGPGNESSRLRAQRDKRATPRRT